MAQHRLSYEGNKTINGFDLWEARSKARHNGLVARRLTSF
jgi:hypothetical protein